MFVALPDDAAAQLRGGLRVLAGHLQGRGQALHPELRELLTDLERSRPRSSDRALDTVDVDAEGGLVTPRMLDYAGASRYTSLAQCTLRKYVASNELRATYFGRSVRFTIEDLDAFIDRHREQVAA